MKQRLDLRQRHPWDVLWVYLTFRYFDNFLECNILLFFYLCIITSFLAEMLDHLYLLCLGLVLVSDSVYTPNIQ